MQGPRVRETARLPELEFMKEFVGAPSEKLTNLMDPEIIRADIRVNIP